MEPVEQDWKMDQVDPCKSKALEPSLKIPDLLENLLITAKEYEFA